MKHCETANVDNLTKFLFVCNIYIIKHKIMAKKIVSIVHIGLRKEETEVIENIKADGNEPSEIIRGLLREYGEKKYKEEKGYSEAAKIRAQLALESHRLKREMKEMTNKEYAENILKAVVNENLAWISSRGGQPWAYDLTKIKQYTTEHPDIKRHLAILNNEPFVDAFGILVTEKEMEEARKNLEAKKMQ